MLYLLQYSVKVSCWVCWPRWPVCDLREERGEIRADVELVAAPLERTRMRRGWHFTSRSVLCRAVPVRAQLRSKFESMKDPLVTARWPDWGPARLGPDPAGKYFPKYFHSFYIFNALAFCFCFVHWMKNILYIFADSRISFREFVCIEPHSTAGAGWVSTGNIEIYQGGLLLPCYALLPSPLLFLFSPPHHPSWLLAMNGLASCLAGLECF